jgi:deoxyribonuclease (pyrimidine dimer)
MTRINVVPPVELYDQHLIAEYRETRLLTQNLKRSFGAKNGLSKKKIPLQFTLNTGHCTFFKDKGMYIQKRYQLLQIEMKNRGFVPKFEEIDISVWPAGYFNDWTPTERDMNIVRERIKEKVAFKPRWYRYYGKPITP